MIMAGVFTPMRGALGCAQSRVHPLRRGGRGEQSPKPSGPRDVSVLPRFLLSTEALNAGSAGACLVGGLLLRARTHARTRARTHTRTRAHIHARGSAGACLVGGGDPDPHHVELRRPLRLPLRRPGRLQLWCAACVRARMDGWIRPCIDASMHALRANIHTYIHI